MWNSEKTGFNRILTITRYRYKDQTMRAQYVNELETVRQNLVGMGDTTISLLGEALKAIADPNPGPSARASELESQTDHQHRLIHDQCLDLITLQAPVASDARLLTGILDAIVDLELIGDYAYEIVTLTAPLGRKVPTQITSQIVEIGGKIRDALTTAIESWRNKDREVALSVRPREAPIRAECEALYPKLAQLVSSPGSGTVYVDIMIVCKHLLRILRHAVCVADQAADAS
jgi:phosphate transport system protein